MLTVGGAVYRQVLATLAACFIMMSCGTFFGWVAPTFVNLLSEGSEIPMTSSEASWAISIIEFGNLWSPIPAGILADRFGRKPVALINGPISILSWLIILYFKSLQSLCIARILQGFVIGNVFTVVPMYLGEIASQNIRGAIVTLSQACFWLGFVFEYVIGPFVTFNSLILCTICLPFAFLVLFPFQPESPHFYSMHEDHENAKKSLMWLRGTTNENDVKNELSEITESVREEMSNKVSFADIIATPMDRRALLIVQMDNGKYEALSKSWQNDDEPYINVLRGKSREWTNLQHSQPLKRSDEAVGFPNPQLPDNLGGLNMTNPISKYHCPINLLYGNNLTVKNYFLLVPRGNESCNDTIQQIQSVSDEHLEAKAMPQLGPQLGPQVGPQGAQGPTVGSATIFGVETTLEATTNVSESTTNPPTPEVNVTFFRDVNNATMEVVVEMLTVTTPENTTVSETTTSTPTTEFNVTFFHEVNNATMEVMVELMTVTTSENVTTTPAPLTSPNISEEILRTLDKYCETFNLSGDGGSYTIKPVSISTNIVAAAEESSAGLKKQKRAPLDINCLNFSMSEDQNYTIQPIKIPQDIIPVSGSVKIDDLKKQKRNLASKRPKRRPKSSKK